MNAPRHLPTTHAREGEVCSRCGVLGPHSHPELNSHLRPGAQPAVTLTMAASQARHLMRLVRSHRRKSARTAAQKRDFVAQPGHLDANLAAVEMDGALEVLMRWDMEQQGFDPDEGQR